MKPNQINVLATDAQWAWPRAMADIFAPCGVELLLAKGPNDALDIIRQRRIHTAIIDMDCETLNGLATVRVIRSHFPRLPCILLSNDAEQELLSTALKLDIFSVIAKPVDMHLLQSQLNKLFLKRYNSAVFAEKCDHRQTNN